MDVVEPGGRKPSALHQWAAEKYDAKGKRSSQGAGREVINTLPGCLPGPRTSEESHAHMRSLHLCQFIVKSSSLSWHTRYSRIWKRSCSLASRSQHWPMMIVSCVALFSVQTWSGSMIKSISAILLRLFVLISHGYCSLMPGSPTHTEISLDRTTTSH